MMKALLNINLQVHIMSVYLWYTAASACSLGTRDADVIPTENSVTLHYIRV